MKLGSFFVFVCFLTILPGTGPARADLHEGLVAHYRFDGNTQDESPYGNHGAPYGNPAYVEGVSGQAFNLDGSDDYVEVPNSPSLNPSSAITVTAWYKTASFAGSGNDPIVDKGYYSHTSPWYQYHLGVVGDKYSYDQRTFQFSVATADGSGYHTITRPGFWELDTWYFIVGTYDGSKIALYVNGVEIDSARAQGAMRDYGKHVRVGRFSNLSYHLKGAVDEVRIYDRALSETEILQLYHQVYPVLPQPGIISGTITDTDGNGISDIVVNLTAPDGSAHEAKTGATGFFAFDITGIPQPQKGVYNVSPVATESHPSFYPSYEIDGEVRCYRQVELMNTAQGIADVDFTTNPKIPFVKLLFPRSGDRLKGDFAFFGTAFKTLDPGNCTGHDDIKALEVLVDGIPRFKASLFGRDSDRFSLSQITWLDMAGNVVTAPWESMSSLIADGEYASIQIKAVNTSDKVGYSERIAITRASTANSAVMEGCELPFPASNEARTLTNASDGSESQTWFIFNWDCYSFDTCQAEEGKKCVEDPTLPKPQRVEYDERLTSGEKSIHQVYPVEDVYPVGLAAMDAEGNTLVSVKKVIAYKAARFGDPEANNSGSMSAAFGANVVSGNFYYQTTDMSLEGVGLPFVLWRRYNSFGHGGESIFGKGGWNHSYSHKIMLGKSGRRLYLVMPDGHWERFAFVDGMWRTMTPGAFWMVWQTADDAFSAWDRNSTRYDFSYVVDVWKVTAITDINGNKLTLSYGTSEPDNGKLISIVDTRGRTISFTYGASGYCEQVSDGTGRSVAYEYDEKGRLKSFTDRQLYADGLGKKWVYEYETFGSADLLARIIDPRGNAAPPEGRYAILTNDYDESLRVISQKDALGNIWQVAYNSPSGKTTVTDPTGREIIFAIDPATQMVTGVKNGSTKEALTEYKGEIQRSNVQEASLVGKSIQPEGSFEALSYSDKGTGNPTSITRSGKITTGLGWEEQRFDDTLSHVNKNLLNTMSVQGVAEPYQMGYGEDKKNLRSITDPLKGVATFDYNARGQVIESTDPRGHTTKRTYDASGYLEFVSDTFTNGRGEAVTLTTSYTYDDKKRLRAVTDRNGEATTYDYDDNDRIKTITDPDGKTIIHSYDESGNLTATTDRRGITTRFEYNKANLIEKKKETTDGVTYETAYAYDGLQRLFRVTNARGYPSDKAFDGAGRTKQVKNPLGQYKEYTYDDNGNVTAVEVHDSDGALVQRTERTYDDLNRLKVSRAKLDQEYLETVYEYYEEDGETGWLKSVTDSKGNKTSFKYDALGRVALVEDAKGNTAIAEYDKNGNLIKVTDPEGHETAYGYDALNRMIWKKDHASEHTWEYDYDGNGNLVYYKSPDGKIISYEYYTQNRLKKITYFDGIELGRYTSYTYDENANVKTMTDFSGVASLVTSYDYDELNRVKLIQDGFGQSVGYGYDGVSNITEITYPGEKKVEYGYDKADRMETVTDWLGHVTTYSYNALSQIRSIVHGNKTKATMDYDTAGRLYYYANNKSNGEFISSYLFTLEKNGNRKTSGMVEPLPPVLQAGSEAYGIDALNRISSGPHGTFSYDAKGNLIGETRGSETITYGYDFEDMLTSWSNGPDKDSYTYKYSGSKNLIAVVKNGAELRHVLDLNRSLPEVLARTDTQGKVKDYFVYGASGLISRITPDGSSHTYHFDPMGNTIAMTDEAQQMTNKYSYTPYGKARKLERVENPFEYVGQYGVMAQDNGLSFMRARFYHPNIRRFVSLDKVWGNMEDPQGLNLYAYVQGNPIMAVDPSGMKIDWSRLASLDTYKTAFNRTLDDTVSNAKHFGAEVWKEGIVKNPIWVSIKSVAQAEEQTLGIYGSMREMCKFADGEEADIIKMNKPYIVLASLIEKPGRIKNLYLYFMARAANNHASNMGLISDNWKSWFDFSINTVGVVDSTKSFLTSDNEWTDYIKLFYTGSNYFKSAISDVAKSWPKDQHEVDLEQMYPDQMKQLRRLQAIRYALSDREMASNTRHKLIEEYRSIIHGFQ